MTLLQRVFNSFHRLVSKLNKDDDERAVFTGSEGDLTNFLAEDLEKVLNEKVESRPQMTRARSSSYAA